MAGTWLLSSPAPSSLRRATSHPLTRTAFASTGSHIELRKRNADFAKKVGTTNKLKKIDPLDKKRPLPAWALWTLLFVVLGGGARFPGRSSRVRGR